MAHLGLALGRVCGTLLVLMTWITMIKVSKSRHNSQTKLHEPNLFNAYTSKHQYLLVLLVSALSFQ